MSIEAMTVVLHHSRQTGTKKLILVGIANHDGDGGAWPTIETLAKYANIDERNVRRRLSEIVEDGELIVHYNAGGNLRTPLHERPNLYEILVSCPPNCEGGRTHRLRPLGVVQGGEGATASPPADELGGGATAPPPGGATAPPPPGATAPRGGGATAPQTVLEPSPNRPTAGRAARSPARDRGTRLPEDWTPSPEDIAAAAADAPDVDLEREFRKFRDHWLGSASSNAIKKRWDTTYRNWMREAQDRLNAAAKRNTPAARPAPADARLAAGMDLAARLRARHQAADPPAPAPPTAAQGGLF